MRIFKKLLISTTLAGIVSAASLTSAFAASTTVSVHPGDTLWLLSQKYHIPVNKIEAANPSVDLNNLQVGSSLTIPYPTNAYTVQAGDTFWTISQKYGVTLNSLLAANPALRPNILLPGATVVIPATNASSTTSYNVQAGNNTSSQNLYWMAHVINAEAGNESLQAQIAVGDVVLHRMQSSGFPNTVQKVVFQKINGYYQFSCVPNGYIYTAPSPSSMKAAQDVLQKNIDVVPGAYVFYNPAQTPSGSWVWNQPTIAKIGNLVFAR